MLRFSTAMIVCLGILGSAHADTWGSKLFPEKVKDFGSVPRGPSLQHRFIVENPTTSTVIISGIRVSCGCVTATASTNTLRPGEKTTIVTDMDTTRFTGMKTVTIYVRLSEPVSEEVGLVVRANGRDDLSVSPTKLSFGQVSRGREATESATITFYGNPRFRIENAKCESSYVEAESREVARDGAKVVYTVTAKLSPETPIGSWYTDLWVSTNDASVSRIRLPLSVEVRSPLTATPDRLSLGEIRVGQSVERRLIVKGDSEFKILGSRGAVKEIALRANLEQRRKVHLVTLELTPTQPGPFNHRFAIVTDLGGGSEVTVVTSATVVP